MDVVFISDDSYAPHLGAEIVSILLSSQVDEAFNFYIVESRLSDQNKQKFHELKKIKRFNLQFIHVDHKRFEKLPIMRTNTETYFRYIFPELFPTLNKILYLDADIIVRGSLKELWNTDISTVYAGAAENGDAEPGRLGLEKYFNAGVILFNLKKMRQDNIIPKLFQNTEKLYKSNQLWLEDQDVLNYTFKNDIIIIPYKYNYPGFAKLKDDTVMIHYVIYKPWIFKTLNFDYYYQARQMTPWRFTQKLYSFKSDDQEEFFVFEKDKKQFCNLNKGRCGKLIPSIVVEWDNGEREAFSQIESGVFTSLFKGGVINVEHEYWSDQLIVRGDKACRLIAEDCGTLISFSPDKFVIQWDGWGRETFVKSKYDKFIYQAE